jgi:hypothetical protein
LLGVEDPQERAEVKRAHHDERVNKRLPDQRAERDIVQSEERAPKRRKGRSLLKPLMGKEGMEVNDDQRHDKDDEDAVSSLPRTQRLTRGLRAIFATGGQRSTKNSEPSPSRSERPESPL